MLPLILAAGMVAKNELVDKPKAEKERRLQAITAQYSPWTGMQAHGVGTPSSIDAGLQGAGMGLGMQQNMDMQDAQMGALKSQSEYYNRGGSQQGMPPTSMLDASEEATPTMTAQTSTPQSGFGGTSTSRTVPSRGKIGYTRVPWDNMAGYTG